MIIEFSHYCLILSLILALLQGWAGLRAVPNAPGNLPVRLSVLHFFLVSASFLGLIWAFTTSDFSVKVVAQGSHSAQPLIYKIGAAWGNHEGSILMWIWIMSAFGFGLSLWKRNKILTPKVLGFHGFNIALMSLFALFTSNPFERLFPMPANGNGLNPILQDPGLAFHPTTLYLGYVGMSLPFAFGLAALFSRNIDTNWCRAIKPWVLIPWSFLTAGIALGSWWAYYELGWGGWWFWDPVENASLLPWLAATALLHALPATSKQSQLKLWTLCLCLLTYLMSLIATFVVRSGLITSVHAFATDPMRGYVIFGMISVLALVICIQLIRSRKYFCSNPISLATREGTMTFSSATLLSTAAVLTSGLFYPLLAGKNTTLDGPFYESILVPLAIPLFLIMGISTALNWRDKTPQNDLKNTLKNIKTPAILTVLICTVIAYFYHNTAPIALLCLGGSVWILSTSLWQWFAPCIGGKPPNFKTLLRQPLPLHAMTLAHCGLAIAVIGMTFSSQFKSEKLLWLGAGEQASFEKYTVSFKDLTRSEGQNYAGLKAVLSVHKGPKLVTTLTPERRLYPIEKVAHTEVAIHTNLLRDLYVVLGEQHKNQQQWAIHLHYNPLVSWIWLGAFLMTLGGLFSLLHSWRRRQR